MGKKSTALPSQMRDRRGRLIAIQAYTYSDYADLREMYDSFAPKGLEAGLPPPDDKTRYNWIDRMTSSLFNVLALHRGRVIGHAGLDISDVTGCPEYLIFIKQGFRNCGIGTVLSETMKKVAKGAGCRKIWLTVRTGNTCAIWVFKKVRFKFRDGIGVEREMELILKKGVE
ncbi:MAG: GNAT family N-acetyltransferase [Proteobacteria bacterium]|nr:GNAT family N-acetyltransferase [Pseudomonadota bacterium]